MNNHNEIVEHHLNLIYNEIERLMCLEDWEDLFEDEMELLDVVIYKLEAILDGESVDVVMALQEEEERILAKFKKEGNDLYWYIESIVKRNV